MRNSPTLHRFPFSSALPLFLATLLALACVLPATARVNPTPQIFLSDFDHIWDGQPKQVEVRTDPANEPVIVTYNGSTPPPRDVGSYAVVAQWTQNSAVSATGTLRIVRAGQTVTFENPGQVVLNTPVNLSATASSGLPVTFIVMSGSATITDQTLIVTSLEPQLVIAARQPGNANYTPAETERTLEVNKRSQTLEITDPGPVDLHTPVELQVTASSGLPVSLQVTSGEATLDGKLLTIASAQTPVVVEAVQSGDDEFLSQQTSLAVTINPNSVNRITNLSSRSAPFSTGNENLILGLVIGQTETAPVLFRAIGPGLSPFGVSTPMADPVLIIRDGQGNEIARNHEWGNDSRVAALGASLGAFPLSADSKDAALVVDLGPGVYTAEVGGGTGQVVAEIYDGAPASLQGGRMLNTSSRGQVNPGEPLIGGIVITGNSPQPVLVRGIGPSLTTYGVPGVLQNPVLSIYDESGNLVATNQGWDTPSSSEDPPATEVAATAQSVGAFALPPGGGDATLLRELPPGVYTVHLTTADSGSGNALLEIYDSFDRFTP